MNKISYYLVMIMGIITCLSFFPHAFMGMQSVLDHIAKGEIQQPAANGMRMIWLYSSIMMLVSGIWLITITPHIRIGSHLARIQILVLGIGLSAFGLGCTYISGKIDTMFAFTIQGVILIAAATLFYKKVHHINEKK